MSKILNLKTDKARGTLEIKNQTETSADLCVYGYISDSKWDNQTVVPADVKALLDEIKDVKTLNIYINSGGGSVFAGMAIYNMLKRCKAEKVVYVDGIAASIASVIAFCGDQLIIPSNAYLMIHKAWTLAIGNSDEMLQAAEMLETIDKGILYVYEENLKGGVSTDAIKQMVEAETWMTGETAAEYFNLTVTEANEAAAYTGPLNYRSIPKGLKREKPEDTKKEKQRYALARLKLALDL